MQKTQPLYLYLLLFLIILIWALVWPISKIGLQDMSPIWYSVMRLCIGFITIFLILLSQGKIIIPKKRDLPFILTIGLLQMASFIVLMNGGLMLVAAGRSAILVYSTPFLVAPIAILFFDERLTGLKLLGLLLGLLGILILFNPWSFDWHNEKDVIGNILLLLAALCWAIAMLHTHYGKWYTPSMLLVPWQLLIACIFVIAAGFIMEPHPHINWTSRLVLTGLYNGILATGLAYTGIIFISRNLPVITTSLLLLAVPVLGLIASAIWLHEDLTWDTIVAMVFIVSGLFLIAVSQPKKFNNDFKVSTR